MEENAMTNDLKDPVAVDSALRRRFWNRLCRLGIVRERELIGLHRVAQARRIAPEEAVVAMGMLTQDQVVELLTCEAPFGFSLAELGIS
jgi:hypothetical protein